jgi:ribosomal protein L16 Arg81 hydroxylase
MYNEWSPHKGEFTLRESFVLSPGDLLYIPKGMYHNTETLSPRISISFHFHEPDGFHKKREEWLDWRP